MTQEPQPQPQSELPTIVGIGASAGGLDAFTRLLGNLPSNTGLAYVLVQHLSPDHESLLPGLLGRASMIPVVAAQDGVRVEANRAYVIPPNASMTLADGHLRLATRDHTRGPHLPIDIFLCSLADVRGPGAVGVILSGAGSDGARGIEAIKESGGITFAQDADSAAHPNMPLAAVATDCVDFVLPPERIAEQIAQLGRHLTSHRVAGDGDGAADDESLRQVLDLVQRQTGVDFTSYRHGTIQRRILRRMLLNRHQTRSEYVAQLRTDPAEVESLFEDLLIGVTSFFRDPAVFDELRDRVLPEMMRRRAVDAPFRVWVAGCSGGEETYSLAIALLEFFGDSERRPPLQVFGTDLSESAVARARAGVYPESIATHVSAERLTRFFVPVAEGYRIAKSVRDLCVFSRQNIVRDPPFSHMDIVSCRNVLIYMEPDLQRRVFPIFHYALEPHGVVLLGSAESPGASSEYFEPVSKQHKLYRRRAGPARPLEFSAPAIAAQGGKRPAPRRRSSSMIAMPSAADDLSAAIDRVVIARFAQTCVVVDDDFEIIHFRGDTATFLAHATGTASLDLLRLARSELVPGLRSALIRAGETSAAVREQHIALATGDVHRHVTIDVLPLEDRHAGGTAFVVLFNLEAEAADVPADAKAGKSGRAVDQTALETLREELASTKRYLREIVQQHEATVEELRAAGEEIQSSNEELQSTNEELETTKEEIQSTNEELTTLNEELQHRNRDLGEMASDLANVFASTTIPIALIGADRRLRRFTPATSRVMKVIPSDTGRPLSDVKLRFSFPELERVVDAAIDTLAVTERTIEDDDGVWWSLTVRPYQTIDRRVNGAVLVFSDIDASKRSEVKAQATSEDRKKQLEVAEEARVAALARANDTLKTAMAERERGEAERNALLRQLDLGQEEERRRLSRELHDEAGQHLAALTLGLQELSQLSPPGSDIDMRAAKLRELSATLGHELHEIAVRLRPKALDDFGLEAALSSYAEEWAGQHGVTVDVHAAANGQRFPAPVESAIYRIVQEALTNVARHSGATHVSVVVERRNGQVHAIVEDNGRGFDTRNVAASATPDGGLGLLGIRERVALLGGAMEIESRPGAGTTLFVRLPLTTLDAARNSY